MCPSLSDAFIFNDSDESITGQENDEEHEGDGRSSTEELSLKLSLERIKPLWHLKKELSTALQHQHKSHAAGVWKDLFEGGSVIAYHLGDLSLA